jgi:Ligand-binding domain of nuclear hormone receptor
MEISRTFEKAAAADRIFAHMVEMTILVTRLIVEFAKHLPGFRDLGREDQIVLLKVIYYIDRIRIHSSAVGLRQIRLHFSNDSL